MVWPVVAIAVGISAFALKYSYRSIQQSNLKTLKLPQYLQYISFSSDKRGFTSPMSRMEAFQILNTSPTASKDKIRENHKQLMMRNHPDNGGSTYVAAKVNEAKDILTKK